MDFNELYELLKPHPAIIKAESDAECKSKVEMRGRHPDLIALAIDIVDSVLEQSPFSIDDFCEIYKDAKNHESDNKQLNDKKEKLIKKILEDM